jgi:hypothetical protein
MNFMHCSCEAAMTALLLITALTLATLYTPIYTSCFSAANKPQQCDYSAVQCSTLVALLRTLNFPNHTV